MVIKCVNCGSSDIYLKHRGMQVGAYCKKCDKWIKWVGKKDLPMYTRKGFKIYDEGYSPVENVGTVSSMSNIGTVNSVQNLGVQEDANIGGAYPSDYQDDFDITFDYTEGYDSGNVFDYPEEESVNNKRVDNCPICTTGNIPLLNDSNVMLRIFDNVLSVLDKDTGDILATARIGVCPCCGRVLK